MYQVAELELLVGSAKGSAGVDQIQAVEILQKLLANIPRTERPRLKEYGRRCEAAMADVLLKGTAQPVSSVRGCYCCVVVEKRTCGIAVLPASGHCTQNCRAHLLPVALCRLATHICTLTKNSPVRQLG